MYIILQLHLQILLGFVKIINFCFNSKFRDGLVNHMNEKLLSPSLTVVIRSTLVIVARMGHDETLSLLANVSSYFKQQFFPNVLLFVDYFCESVIAFESV